MVDRLIKVFLAEQHQMVREGLRLLLWSHGDFSVVGEASNGAEAIERIPPLDPDVAVLAVEMPVKGGIEATRWLREHHARTEVVALSTHHAEAYQREAFESGARGYVLQEAPFEQLADAIQSAARGDYYLAGSVGRDLVQEYVKPLVARQKPGGHITARERELAVLLGDGYSTKEAAAVLNISVRTADTHRQSLMRKLDARNVADIVKYCIRNGLIGA